MTLSKTAKQRKIHSSKQVKTLTSKSRMMTRFAPAALAAWAASAALLKKQNPMGVADSAWCPGGRTIAAPIALLPLQHTACLLRPSQSCKLCRVYSIINLFADGSLWHASVCLAKFEEIAESSCSIYQLWSQS